MRGMMYGFRRNLSIPKNYDVITQRKRRPKMMSINQFDQSKQAPPAGRSSFGRKSSKYQPMYADKAPIFNGLARHVFFFFWCHSFLW